MTETLKCHTQTGEKKPLKLIPLSNIVLHIDTYLNLKYTIPAALTISTAVDF